MSVFNVKEYLPVVQKLLYVGPLEFTTKFKCSKELINRMIVAAERAQHHLKTLVVSEEDMKDIASYCEDEVAEETRKQILEQAAEGATWGISLEVDELLNGSGVLIGLTDEDWAVVVGETGRYNEATV
jgi:hypothetical protein